MDSLILKGADVNTPDNADMTALSYAAYHGKKVDLSMCVYILQNF